MTTNKLGDKQMNLRVATKTLKEMTAKAVMGASNNKLIPITGLLSIMLEDGVLSITSTDAMNILVVMEHDVGGEYFEVVVQADIFSKLIGKLTSEYTSLEVADYTLFIKANGSYKIELPLDEEGELISFPQYEFKIESQSTVKLSDLKSVLKVNKAAVADTMEIPYLTGYYCGEQVLTTDTYKICSNDIKLFEQIVLLPSDLMNLLSLLDQEEIIVYHSGNKISFATKNIYIRGTELDDIEDYPVESILGFVQQSMPGACQVDRKELLSVLDRFSLFAKPFESNGVYVTFTQEGINFGSKGNSAVEILPYLQKDEDNEPFTCHVDVGLLEAQVKAQDSKVVNLFFGVPEALKMVHGDVTQVVALLEDDR